LKVSGTTKSLLLMTVGLKTSDSLQQSPKQVAFPPKWDSSATTKIGESLSESNFVIGDDSSISYERVVTGSAGGEGRKYYINIYPPASMSADVARALKANLKRGNPLTYGLPDKQAISQKLDAIFQMGFVIKVTSEPRGKFGATAILVPHAEDGVGYIGQVVSGPRDPNAGQGSPSASSEKGMTVRSGGQQALTEAINLAEILGYKSVRLYTNSEGLAVAPKGSQKLPYYAKIGEKLGLPTTLTTIAKGDDAEFIVTSGSESSSKALLLKPQKIEYHFAYDISK